MAGLAIAPAPARAQVCLDCFTETLGANPFAAPVVLQGEALVSGTLGLAGPYDNASLLPNLLARYGVRDGLELTATLGYEPSLGARAALATPGPITVLGAARFGYAYFRTEWLGEASLPLLWSSDGWSLRAEPQVTFNQITGNHVALELAIARLVAPGTSIALVVAPDYRVAERLVTGAVTIAGSRTLSPRWAAYVLGSLYVIDRPTPLVAVGLTYLPPPRD
jgi:hypothetical protein